ARPHANVSYSVRGLAGLLEERLRLLRVFAVLPGDRDHQLAGAVRASYSASCRLSSVSRRLYLSGSIPGRGADSVGAVAPLPLSLVIVRVELPVPLEARVTTGGLNVPVVLVGRPLTDRLTLPLKLLSEDNVTLYVTLPGRTTVLLVGLTVILKSGWLGMGVLV